MFITGISTLSQALTRLTTQRLDVSRVNAAPVASVDSLPPASFTGIYEAGEVPAVSGLQSSNAPSRF